MINRSAAARAGHAALRARIEAEGFNGEIGPDAYKAYMRHLRQRGPADLSARGGRACHKALRRSLGSEGYSAWQRVGFDAAVARHGRDKVLAVIERAHGERRSWRLHNPTAAEKMLQLTLCVLGYTVHPDTHKPWGEFEYGRWSDAGGIGYEPRDLLLEARVGRYYCTDVLIPALALVIEVIGGVHAIQEEEDGRRLAFLKKAGLTVWIFTNEEAFADGFRELLAARLQAHQEQHHA
jgi:hypothetical protein